MLEDFLKKNTKDGGFMQSKHSADFKNSGGTDALEFGNDEFRALAVENKLPIVGSYWYIPRGPVFEITNNKSQDPNKSQIPNSKVQTCLDEIIETAKNKKIGWVRVEPQDKKTLDSIKEATSKYDSTIKIKKSKKNHEAAQMLMIDLSKSEDELLAGMKSKTRYNIRLSIKKGIKIFETKKGSDVEKFCDLVEETSKRDGITPHPRNHYKKMLKEINSDIIKLYLASYQDDVIAGAIIVSYGGVATYLHGASASSHRNVMAPFGLHWHIMKKAKNQGMKKYNLGGTKLVKNKKADAKDEHVPETGNWQGITRFKLGFCKKAKPINFPGCYDIVISSKKYLSYRILQFIKDLTK